MHLDPSSLILSHLSLDGFNALLRCVCLLPCDSELPIYSLTGLGGIYDGLSSLGIQESSLFTHFAELLKKNPGSNYANGHQDGRENDHPRIGTISPFGAFLLIIGLTGNLSATWLIGSRSWDCRRSRGIAFCILSGILVGLASVSAIWHGLNLVVLTRL
jgi:hypothetical protein